MTQQLPADDRYVITQPELEDRLTVMMEGRAAELLVFGELSTGAQNDLQQATALARRMIEEFGMSKKVGPLALSRPSVFLGGDGFHAEHLSARVASEVDAKVRRLLEAAEARAETILAEHRGDIDRETLEGDELRAALSGTSPSRPAASLTGS